MLSIIETILSLIGFCGALQNNTVLMIVGLIGIIICDFIDVFVTKHNPTTIIFAIIFATGMSIANKNPLYSFTFALCIENLLLTIFFIFSLLFAFLFNKNKNNELILDKNKIIQELMQESNLSQQICTDIYNILLDFRDNNKDNAYLKINNTLIPHLKEEGNAYNLGVAFGMLIDEEYALTKEEATDYIKTLTAKILTKE